MTEDYSKIRRQELVEGLQRKKREILRSNLKPHERMQAIAALAEILKAYDKDRAIVSAKEGDPFSDQST